MQTVISTNALVRRFGDVTAVDGLSLEVKRGEIFGFLGHNGAGKTTTIRLLNGVLLPTEGSLEVLGLDPVKDGPALRRSTGVLTETPSLDERMTARENLKVYAELYDVPRDNVDNRVEELLEQFELADRADEKAGGYSKGMKQRLAVARALLHNPELLFLDEPTAGLDPVAMRRIHDLILSLSKAGHTIVLCTHNLTDAQKLCDRVAVLEHGRTIALGTPAELAERFSSRQRLELEVSKETMPVTLESLKQMQGVSDIEQVNGRIVSFSGVGYEAIPDLVALLTSAGVRLYRVMPHEPSLEDVYFALHAQSEAANLEVVS